MLVHQVGKGIFTAGNVFGQRHTGVVTGLDDHAMQQIVHRYLLAYFNKHTRAASAPGFFANGYQILLANLAIVDFTGGNVGSHQLSQAGRWQFLVAIVLHQNLTGGGVHQHIRLGRQLRRGRNGRLGSQRSTDAGQQNKTTKNCCFNHVVSLWVKKERPVAPRNPALNQHSPL